MPPSKLPITIVDGHTLDIDDYTLYESNTLTIQRCTIHSSNIKKYLHQHKQILDIIYNDNYSINAPTIHCILKLKPQPSITPTSLNKYNKLLYEYTVQYEIQNLQLRQYNKHNKKDTLQLCIPSIALIKQQNTTSGNLTSNNSSNSLVLDTTLQPTTPTPTPTNNTVYTGILYIDTLPRGQLLSQIVANGTCRIFTTRTQTIQRKQQQLLDSANNSPVQETRTLNNSNNNNSTGDSYTPATKPGSDSPLSSLRLPTRIRASISSTMQLLDIGIDLCSYIAYLHELQISYNSLASCTIMYDAQHNIKTNISTDCTSYDTNTHTNSNKPLTQCNPHRIQLLDYSGVSLLNHERVSYADETNIPPYLFQYVAPEVTGRMNRSVDNRADLWSIGVVMYELSCGHTPFALTSSSSSNGSSNGNKLSSTDVASTVHHIIAKSAPTLQQLYNYDSTVITSILNLIAQIIYKLLSKQPEDRYQTARGLHADLIQVKQILIKHTNKLFTSISTNNTQSKNSLSMMAGARSTTAASITGAFNSNKMDTFIIGKLDYDSTFRVSQKMYGRSEQTKQLLDAFDRISGVSHQSNSQRVHRSISPTGQPELVLVSGFSGIGKTSLVNEVHKPIVRSRGIFIRAKFDLYKRHVSCLLNAFQSLLDTILTQSNDKLEFWSNAIQQAIGSTGQTLVDVLPQLEQLIGKQPALPQLSGTETQNRFDRTFISFVNVFARHEHPLVIFVDDLQWADTMSFI